MSKFPEIDRLREALRKVNPGNSGLVSMVGKPVMERGFFPGGNGLLLGENAPEFPAGRKLILGSNFGADEKFCTPDGKLVRLDETNLHGTWTGLRRRFSTEQLRECFFTNAWPFLHVGESNNPVGTVKQKWLRDPVLMKSCVEFFQATLREVQPSLIVELGTAPAAFLSSVFPKSLAGWRGNTWHSVDQSPLSIVQSGTAAIACVAITHPSMSNAHQRIEKFATADKERELLQVAIQSGETVRLDRGSEPLRFV